MRSGSLTFEQIVRDVASDFAVEVDEGLAEYLLWNWTGFLLADQPTS